MREGNSEGNSIVKNETHEPATLEIALRVLPHAKGLQLPQRATAGSVGYDLSAAIEEKILLKPRVPEAIPCGIAIALPETLEAQIRPRSGLALKHAITCLNTPGTIDSDYRGEVKVILINHGEKDFLIERGMRIAQMVFARYESVRFNITQGLTETARQANGFGASGMGELASLQTHSKRANANSR